MFRGATTPVFNWILAGSFSLVTIAIWVHGTDASNARQDLAQWIHLRTSVTARLSDGDGSVTSRQVVDAMARTADAHGLRASNAPVDNAWVVVHADKGDRAIVLERCGRNQCFRVRRSETGACSTRMLATADARAEADLEPLLWLVREERSHLWLLDGLWTTP